MVDILQLAMEQSFVDVPWAPEIADDAIILVQERE
jgi:hypothetical protein